MSLYHIHRVYNHDELYKPDNTIIVDDSFNNRISDKINNTAPTVSIINLADPDFTKKNPGGPNYTEDYNELARYLKRIEKPFTHFSINMGEFLELVCTMLDYKIKNSRETTQMPNIPYEDLPKLLKDLRKYLDKRGLGQVGVASKLTSDKFLRDVQWLAYEPESNQKLYDEKNKINKESFNIVKKQEELLSELAFEQARLMYAPDKPSRMHTIFACKEAAIQYWINEMKVKKKNMNGIEVAHIYEVESDIPEKDIFRTKSIKFEDKNFGERVKAARSYFEPVSFKDDKIDEFLLKGKVRIIKRREDLESKYSLNR